MKKKKKKRKVTKKTKLKKNRNKKSRKKSKSRKKRKKTKSIKYKSKKASITSGIYNRFGISKFINFLKLKINFKFQKFLERAVSPLINKIQQYKKNKIKLKIKKIKDKEKEHKIQISLRSSLLKKEIKEEQALAKIRATELKNFLRDEQKNIRDREKQKHRKFLEEVKLEKTLEKFRSRELSEINAIEKYSLNIEKEDFKAFQKRIELVKEKYKILRNERLRKRVEELGVILSDQSTIEEIKQKEQEYLQRRELIETSLESFVRSATSLIYQINKRYLPKNADLLRVINLLYEQSEIIIREDQEQNENFLLLIYIKDQDVKKDLIIVEDKSNPDNHQTRQYKRNEIFKFGDDLTDSMIKYLERIRESSKKAS